MPEVINNDENNGERLAAAGASSPSITKEDEHRMRHESQGVERTRNITRGLGSLTVQNLVGSGLAFVFLGSLLRLVSQPQYGVYSAVLVSTGIGGTVSVFGLSFAAARYVALHVGEEGENSPKAWGAARAALNLSFFFSLAAAAVFAALAPALSTYFTKSTQSTPLFLLGSLWLFSNSFGMVLQGIIQGEKKYTLLAKMLLVSRFLMVGFTIAGLYFVHDVSIAIIAWLIYNSLIVVWSLKASSKNLSFLHFSSEERPRGPRPYASIVRYSLPLGIAGILGVLSSSGDLVVVGGLQNLASFGAYNASVQISAVLNIVLILPLITALLPEASSSFKSDSAQVSNGLRLAIRFLMLGLLPASFLVAALSTQLLGLFSGGGSYFVGAPSLDLIALTYIFVGIESAVLSLLQAIGRTVQVLIIGVIMAGADILGALLFVPEFGIFGAAISKAIVAVIGMMLAAYYARDYMRKLDSFASYLKQMIASAVPFLIVLALSSSVSNRTISLVPYSVLFGALLLILFKALGIFTEEDRALLSHILPAPLHRFLRFL